jgi:ABC-2 type transport system permease protein
VSLRGIAAVIGVESAKLAEQIKTWIVLAVCVAGPFVFAVAIRVQTSLPEDTLFGRAVKESGFALALVVLGFAALWVFPVLTGVVGGDLFASEDRYGTWKTLLTRSRTRFELFAGKVATALGFSSLALAVLAASSIVAGVLVIGPGQLIDLSGSLLTPSQALWRVALAWTSALPPLLGLTAVAVLLSVVTRSSAAGVGLPVVAALTMELCSLIDGPEVFRRLLITSAFSAWHGVLAEPAYYGPLVHGAIVSSVYFAVSLAIACRTLQRRDIAGQG